MSPQTLLLVSTSYPETGDGSEAAGAFVADLAKALSEQVRVRVVAPGTGGGKASGEHDIEVHRFASPGKPLSLLSAGNPADWPAIVRTLASLRRTVMQAAADGQVGHCLALWVLPSGWAAAALAGKRAVPYSVWALGSDIWSLGRMPLVRRVLARVSRGAKRRYADGIGLCRDASRLSGQAYEFLPSTRDLAGGRASPLRDRGPYRLLYLGRWHPNKGIDLLLDALAQLGQEDWEHIAEVHIAGGGPMQALVEQRVGELAAQGRPVRLGGYLDKEAARDALGSADYLLLPSRVESIPVVFSDAMKAGLPLIACPVGDIPGLVAELPVGVLARDIGAGAYADAIKSAVRRSPCSYRDNLAAMSERFDIRNIADRLVEDLLGADRDQLAR